MRMLSLLKYAKIIWNILQSSKSIDTYRIHLDPALRTLGRYGWLLEAYLEASRQWRLVRFDWLHPGCFFIKSIQK